LMRAKENEIREQAPGKLLLLPDFPSRFIPSRNLAIWLPPGYGEQSDQRYRVIYAHDGQNLFDPATSFAGVDWGLQWTLSRLIAEGSVAGTLVVGIWNTPQRYREYDPEKVFERYLSPKEKTDYIREFGRPLADRYL